MRASPLFSAILCLSALATAGHAEAFSGTVTPTCDSAGVVRSVVNRFEAYSDSYLGRPVAIAQLGHIRENRLEPRAHTFPRERRYCQAPVVTSDGAKRQLWYMIESSSGFVSLGSEVEFCVSGLDPLQTHGGLCSTVR